MASADRIVDVIAALLLLAHIAVLVWAGLLRKGIASAVALNLIVSAGVIAYWAPHIVELLTDRDAMLAFVAVEVLVFGSSLLALTPVRAPRALVWLPFAVHLILAAAALAFMLTFKIDRLM